MSLSVFDPIGRSGWVDPDANFIRPLAALQTGSSPTTVRSQKLTHPGLRGLRSTFRCRSNWRDMLARVVCCCSSKRLVRHARARCLPLQRQTTLAAAAACGVTVESRHGSSSGSQLVGDPSSGGRPSKRPRGRSSRGRSPGAPPLTKQEEVKETWAVFSAVCCRS